MEKVKPAPSVPDALERIQRYVAMRDAKPIKMLDDEIHSVHVGSEWEAVLNVADLRAVFPAGCVVIPAKVINDAMDCIGALGIGKGGWAWEEMLDDLQEYRDAVYLVPASNDGDLVKRLQSRANAISDCYDDSYSLLIQAATALSKPSKVESAIQAFEDRERGLPQAEIAARLVAEIRKALA